MKTTWKFTLAMEDRKTRQTILMPEGAEVIAVQTQFDMVQAWAIVEPERPLRPVQFDIRMTGHPLGAVGRYIGTVQLDGGALVYHVFVAYPETRAA